MCDLTGTPFPRELLYGFAHLKDAWAVDSKLRLAKETGE
jgi:hypothetical protein